MGTESQTIFRGRIINPVGPDRVDDIRDGMLVVDGAGRIAGCGPFDGKARGSLVDLSGRLIVPGLVDVHSHIPQLDARGKGGATLLKWLERYILPAEAAFSDPAVVADVATRFFKKLILNGTTTAGLYSSVHEDATDRCFEIAYGSGVRCFIGKVMMDRFAPPELIENTVESLAASERLAARWHGAADGRLSYAFTPRFAPACSMELMRGAAKLARESGAYFQSHIAETVEENARVRELFPRHRDYVELFEDAGALGPRTILAHAIHLSEDEFSRLGKSKTKIAHCPTSNFFLKSGDMPADRVEAAGIEYGLGTDVGAGTSMSIFTAMRHADYAQARAAVGPRKAFWLATMGGAGAMSMERDTGNLAQGKFADFNVVDIAGIDQSYRPSDLDADEILSLLMYRGDSRAIEATYVSGNRLDVDAI
ncbi:MAG: guanine deaminase [Proteobacteria bacterium]|nr:guanine deaminase [Pseudomonadota bacterium]